MNLLKIKIFFQKKIAFKLVLIFIIIALVGGFFIGKSQGKLMVVTDSGKVKEYGEVTGKSQELPEYLSKNVDFSLFWQVWNKIQNNYIDRPVGETQLLYGAMSGLVSALKDPYSVFLEPQPAKDFQDDLSGKFEGIGAEIGIRDDLLTIISPLPESPAEKAGLKAKDRVTEIDGESTESISLTEAVRKIRGEKGTTVVLKVYRGKDNAFYDIPIVRDTIKLVSVRFEMKEDDVAYIRITNFNSDTDARFKQAVDQVLLENPQGIILDLRNNPGGYLDRAVTISSYWLPQGEVVVQEQFKEKENHTQYLANGGAQLKDYPTVVLVNEGSASASEIVAGALRDHGLAQLVGQQTFGKGSVQSLENLSDGSAIKLTIARWLTPNGDQIDVIGLKPDFEVEITEEDVSAGEDPQLEKAAELLK